MSATQSKVKLNIDGQDIEVATGTSILDAGWKLGIEIPVLCHELDKKPAGACRMCVVDIHARSYAAACTLKAEINTRKKDPNGPDMVVLTGTQDIPTATKETKDAIQNIRTARATLLNLLMADHPTPCFRQENTHDCELERLAKDFGA